MTRERLPTAFIPHGGGPWPLMPLPGMPNEEATALRGYMESIARVPSAAPRALLVVSAHWEAEKLTVNSGAAPGMLYDYGGFPQEAYELQWPAPGHPAVATEVRQRLERAGFATDEDAERGFDHGVFIPLLAAFPAPAVPVVQLSLKRGLDPAEHLSIGRALAPLRDDGVFIVGSGNSFHNLRAFFRERTSAMKAHSEAFDAWLASAIAAPADQRAERLTGWAQAPSARASHPREEHLLPLMVVAGAAEADLGTVAWSGTQAGFRISAHHFG